MGEETNRSASRSSNEIRDRVSDPRSSMIVSVSNWIDDGLVVAFFFVRALPLRSPASRWIFSLLTSNCFYHLFYVFVHGGLRQESMKIDRRIGLLKTGVPVFLAFSPLVCSPMSNVRADWQPVFLWPLPPDSSLPLSLPPPIPIPAQTLSHSPRPPPPGPPRYPVFSLSSALSPDPFYLSKERQPVKKQTCPAARYASDTRHRRFLSRRTRCPRTKLVRRAQDSFDTGYGTGDTTHSIHFSTNSYFAYKARSRDAASQLNAFQLRATAADVLPRITFCRNLADFAAIVNLARILNFLRRLGSPKGTGVSGFMVALLRPTLGNPVYSSLLATRFGRSRNIRDTVSGKFDSRQSFAFSTEAGVASATSRSFSPCSRKRTALRDTLGNRRDYYFTFATNHCGLASLF